MAEIDEIVLDKLLKYKLMAEGEEALSKEGFLKLLKFAVSLGVSEATPENVETQTIFEYLTPKVVDDFQKAVESSERVTKYATVAAETMFALGNTGLAAGGLCIAGVSAQNYLATKNPIARFCYGTSIFFGSTATITGTIKTFSSICGISYVAMCGDGFGGVFLYLGNRARTMGQYAEGKSKFSGLNPFRNRGFKPSRKPRVTRLTGYKGIGFINPGQGIPQILHNLPYQEIIVVAGTLFAIYSYGKLIIAISRKLASKFSPEMDYSKLIRSQAAILINMFSYTQSVKRVYHFTIA